MNVCVAFGWPLFWFWLVSGCFGWFSVGSWLVFGRFPIGSWFVSDRVLVSLRLVLVGLGFM